MIRIALRSGCASALIAGATHAQILYSTDFEPPEWMVGQRLHGSNQWNLSWVGGNNEVDTITEAIAVSGTQSIWQDPRALRAEQRGGAGRLLDFDTRAAGRPIIHLSWQQFIRTGSAAPVMFGMTLCSGAGPSPWPFIGVLLVDTDGLVWILDGDGELLSTGVRVPVYQWLAMEMIVDFENRTYTARVDGETVAEDSPVYRETDHYLRSVGTITYALTNESGSFGYLDDILIEAFPSASCYPDCDTTTGPGVLDIFDFLCFGNRFSAGDPYACDCDTGTGQGVCDIFDFLCFGNAFNAGCP